MPAACGSSTESDAERFCGEIGQDVAAVIAPAVGDEASLSGTLEHYRMLADLAPIAIEPEWRDLVVNLETANTVVRDDPASVQRAVAQAYATEQSAVVVRDWLLANCSIDLGPVATIAPQDLVTPRHDDLRAPADTEAPDG